MIIHLVTLDQYRERPGISTVVGYTITLESPGGPEIFITSGTAYCGGDRVKDIAESLVAKIDEVADVGRRALQK